METKIGIRRTGNERSSSQVRAVAVRVQVAPAIAVFCAVAQERDDGYVGRRLERSGSRGWCWCWCWGAESEGREEGEEAECKEEARHS